MIFNEKLKLKVENTILSASNLILTKGQKSTRLTADVAVAATTTALNVANYIGIADDDYLLIGNWGEQNAEIVQVNDASIDASVTVDALKYDHYADTPVTVIAYNQIEFYRAATLVNPNSGGSVTLLGSAVNLMAFRLETIYKDAVNSTGYGYFRFKNSTVYSEYSEGVTYDELPYNSISEVCEEAVSSVGLTIGDKYCEEEQLIRDANEAQAIITRAYDWIFEIEEDETSIASTENENKYALSSLTNPIKYTGSKQGILDLKFGSKPLKYIDINKYDDLFKEVAKTTLSVTAAVAATSITLTDTYEFADSGVIYLGENVVTYTTNTKSTGVLSGISASNITVEVISGATVWQGVNPGIPQRYTIFDGSILLDVPVETDEVGKKIKIKYLRKLDRYVNFSDTIVIPFQEALSKYITYKIEVRRKNKDNATLAKNEFNEIVAINASNYKLQVLEQDEYYNFGFDNLDE